MATAYEFFHQIAKPTAEEFLSSPRQIRHAFLSAIVLYHVHDYWKQESPGVTLEALFQACPEFKIIHSVANASKHCRLTRDPKLVTASDQITQKSYPGLFQANFGSAMFAEASEVQVTLDDGTVRRLKPIVKAVLAMWAERIPFNP